MPRKYKIEILYHTNGPEEERRHGTKPKPQKKIPQRKCVGCAERREKRELIRVVRLPDQGGVVLDDTGKKAGRGAIVSQSGLFEKSTESAAAAKCVGMRDSAGGVRGVDKRDHEGCTVGDTK